MFEDAEFGLQQRIAQEKQRAEEDDMEQVRGDIDKESSGTRTQGGKYQALLLKVFVVGTNHFDIIYTIQNQQQHPLIAGKFH